MNHQQSESGEQKMLTPAEEELIDRVAEEILDRFRPAFEELAK